MASPASGSNRRFSSDAFVFVVFTVAAIVLVNVAGARLYRRMDLTEDHLYTLSPASKQLVRSLRDTLTIKAYLSSSLPPEWTAARRYVLDLLEEYRVASGGKVRVEAYDPDSNPKLEEEAGRCRIGRTGVQVRRGTSAEIGGYFLGLCFWYDGKSRDIPQISRSAGLEYQISALIHLIAERRRKVVFTTGHGEQDLGTQYSFVKLGLREEMTVAVMNPSVNPIDDETDALVVAGPRQPLDDTARREIDRYLMKGKSALFLIDGLDVPAPPAAAEYGELDRREARPIDTGLDELLERYGFAIGRDLVLDRENVPGPAGTEARPVLASDPPFVGVKPDPTAARELSIFEGVPAAVIPFASSVGLVGPLRAGAPPPGSGARLWTLARSSPGSWKQDAGPFSLSADRYEAAGARGPFVLAYAYQGILPSAYLEGRSSSRPVRLLVMGDSDFVSDPYMQLVRTLPIYAGGPQMLFNAVNWGVEDETLTPLRANMAKARPIEAPSPDRALAIKWANAAGVPAAVCVAGLLRWRWRQAARRRQRLGGPQGGRA